MAESEATETLETVQVKKLKYLDFVRVAVVHVVFRLSAVYEYAKDNSGPLKSGVQTVEVTVRTVIGPVYDKFHGVPDDLLYFVDRKVDEFITDVDGHVPLLIKQAFRSSASRGGEHCEKYRKESVYKVRADSERVLLQVRAVSRAVRCTGLEVA